MHAKKLFIGWTVVLIAVAGLWIGPNLKNSKIQIMGLGGGGTTSAPDTVKKASEADITENEDDREDAAFEMEFEPMMYSRGMPPKYDYDEVKTIAAKTDSDTRKSKKDDESIEADETTQSSSVGVSSAKVEDISSRVTPKEITK